MARRLGHPSFEPGVGRHHRPAVGTKAARESGRRFPAYDVLRAAHSKAAGRACHVGGERRAVTLAAARAVTMRHPLERGVELPGNSPAETAGLVHAYLP